MKNQLFSNIPDELKAIPQWVCWAWENRNGKPSKVPKNPRTGGNAGSTYPDTWGSFKAAVQACEKFRFDGIGWVFREGSGYFGVDLDHCIEDVELCNEFVNSLQSYNEFSTSGTGLHIICKGVLPSGKKRHNNVEMYSHGRYFVFTGNVYDKQFREIVDCSESIKPLREKYYPPEEPMSTESIQDEGCESELDDDELLNMAFRSKGGITISALYFGVWEGLYESQSNADLALCCRLAFWAGRDALRIDRLFRGSGLMRAKWDEKHGEQTYGQMTISKAIGFCKDVYRGGSDE